MQRSAAWLLVPGMLGTFLIGCSAQSSQESVPSVPTVASPSGPTPVATPTPTPTPTPAAPPEVSVELASVTLADDCGAPAEKAATKSKAKMNSKADSASPEGPVRRRRCEQTSMQLALVAGTGDGPVPIAIKEVALFETDGTALGTLAPGAATVWTDAGYGPWDQQLAPGQSAKVSYVLASPDWATIKGRHGKTFRVRVTVTIGAASKTIEKQVVSAPEMVEIQVKT